MDETLLATIASRLDSLDDFLAELSAELSTVTPGQSTSEPLEVRRMLLRTEPDALPVHWRASWQGQP